MTRFNQKFGKQDVILVTGDFVTHHVAISKSLSEEEAQKSYALLVETLGHVNELVAQKFPDTLVLPAFGNNDPKYYSNPLPDEDAPFYYSYVFNLWFKLLPGNQKALTKE